jgi:hypothetical protein
MSETAVPEETVMDQPSRTGDPAERAFWSWLAFWVQLLVLGVLAIVGAFFASAAARPGDYSCGMVLVIASIALAFLRLKTRLDQDEGDPGDFLLVGDMQNLAVVIPLFTIIGLAGLFVANAWGSGALHTAGVALFVVSGLIVFLDIKHVFDRRDCEPH